MALANSCPFSYLVDHLAEPTDELRICANDIRLNSSTEIAALKESFVVGLTAIKKKIFKERQKLYELKGEFYTASIF
jgi:hypothetical protein